MRFKLAHQLSLLLACAALLAVLAISAVVWWNLRAGFSDYLKARDEVQLTRLADLIAAHSANDPELEWLRGSRSAMQALMTEFRGYERRSGPPRPPSLRDAPPDLEPDDRPPPHDRSDSPPRPPATLSPDSIEGWIRIYDAQGQWLAGRPQEGSPSAARVVTLQGRPIAEVRLFRTAQPTAVDAGFLQRQYLGLGFAGLFVLLLSLIAAWLVARRWAMPLKALQQATERIAAGDLNVRIQPKGALEIAQLMADVNRMTESLDSLQRARRLWIAQISHELRTPLSVLRGELESVQDGAREANATLINNLLDEVLHLGRLVGDLHTLSMADVGQLHCEFQTQNVASELLRIAQRYTAIAQSHGLVLHIDPAVNPNPSDFASSNTAEIWAHWDMRRIHQVLTNLLENSLRYTDAPGRIVLQWWVQSSDFCFTIEDSAPSVPKDAIPQLFEPLYRADTARQRKADGSAGGSGLGLAIVRAIVYAHHGTIQASHSALGGIKIELTLPLKP